MSLEHPAEAPQSKERVVPDNEFTAYLEANLRFPQHFFPLKTVLAAEIALNPQINVKEDLFAKLSPEQLVTARRAMERVHHAYNIRSTPKLLGSREKKRQADAPPPQRPVVRDEQLQNLWIRIQTDSYDFIGHVLGAKDSEGKSFKIESTSSQDLIEKFTDAVEKKLADPEARAKMQNFFAAVREIMKEQGMLDVGKRIREVNKKLNEAKVTNSDERWDLYELRTKTAEEFCDPLFKKYEEKTGTSMSPDIQEYCRDSVING